MLSRFHICISCLQDLYSCLFLYLFIQVIVPEGKRHTTSNITSRLHHYITILLQVVFRVTKLLYEISLFTGPLR